MEEIWKITKRKQTAGKRQKDKEGRECLENVRETTGESETWETGRAQPQVGFFPERMRKHPVEFLGVQVWPRRDHKPLKCL